MRLGIFVPDRVVHVRDVVKPWVARVNERLAEYGYEIKLMAGGSLGRDGEMQLRLLTAGVSDITWFPTGYVAGRLPAVPLLEIPYLSDDPEDLTQAFWRLYTRGLLDGLSDVHPLALSVSPANFLHLAFDLETLDGLSNRKIRVANAAQARIVGAVGGTAVGGITATQVAESLSRNMIDGTLFSWHGTRATGIERTTRTHVRQPLAFSPSALVMNKQRYESLPKEVQDIIDAESGEALSLAFTRAMMKEADQAVARMEASPDHHFYEPSAQEAQLFYDAFARMAVDWGGEDAKRLALIEDLRAILADIARKKEAS
ncbi:hypothetical protein GCM10007972_16220 [Iodidimonas muriae]|uniref:Uncharacterized protein n=1 Tax=Iodidimonas muriae TaxID=261467 RepID=A0ABQ2LD92_9PROT|nr:hypothetical protein GCM10007972_16220 [Iodidimonas muriae]